MIDKNAGQLIAHSLVQQQCRDRRVNAARQRAEHALVAYALLERSDRALGK